MIENNRTPDDQPTVPLSSEGAPAAEPAATAPKRRGRTALIAGGAVIGAVLLAGGGAAVGAAIADDDDDDDRVMSQIADGTRGDTRDGDREAASGAVADELGAASAGDLETIVQAATAAAEGQAVSIDANRDGSWDVQLRGADGSETEVRVGADGTATVTETDAADGDDTAPQNVLDAATLRLLVDAALAETDGRVTDLDADDDSRSPFDVTVLTGDGRTVDIELAADGTVVRTDLDD